MKVLVTKNDVVIVECDRVNEGEVCVNICEFDLPECFAGLSVTAAFNNIPVPVYNNKCTIPSLKKGTAVLGVYAYRENDDGVELMYSPKPTTFYVGAGSYSDEIGVENTPTIGEFEQYCKNFSESLTEIVRDCELQSNKTTTIDENSTNEQYPGAKAVIDAIYENMDGVRVLNSSDFVNGSFTQSVGIESSEYWIATSSSIPVKIGDKITIKPNGLKVWWRIQNSDDLSVAVNLKNNGAITENDEYISEFDGWVFVQIAQTEGTRITPADYVCSIKIGKNIPDKINENIQKIENLEKNKQNILVSGENIKTINGESILGAGDINIVPYAPKVFEEIATVTVVADEDGGLPTVISITADNNGNPFELTDIYCEVLMGLTDGNSGKFNIKAGDKYILGNYNPYFTNTLRKWFFRYDSYGEGLGGLCVAPGTSLASTSSFPNSNVNGLSGQPIPAGQTIIIDSLTVTVTAPTTGAKTFVEGTTITLWGVRKK